jgi:hypothetical protein
VVVALVTPAHEQAEAKRDETAFPLAQAVCAYAGTFVGMTVVPAVGGKMVVLTVPEVTVTVLCSLLALEPLPLVYISGSGTSPEKRLTRQWGTLLPPGSWSSQW